MKKRHSYISGLLLLAGGFLFSLNSHAECYPSAPYSAPVTLQGGTFSAGEDMTGGTIIRIQRINGYRNNYVPCNRPAPYYTFIASGGTLYPGQTYIYQTGVEGLGVRFRNVFYNTYYGNGGRGGFSGTSLAERFTVAVEFIRMGPISAGQVNTSLFPVLSMPANDADGRYNVATYSFAGGGFTVQIPTCTTPNYTYDLGSWIVTYFSSANPGSPWIDTPVTLTNCPVFYGNNSNGSYSNYTITDLNGGGTATNSGSLAPNVLQMSLTPNTTALDATNGTVSLDSSASAVGVAVQLGNRQSGTYVVQNLNNAMSVSTEPGSNTTTVSFPLGARIVKTNVPVRAGSVSTSLTYTISYQ